MTRGRSLYHIRLFPLHIEPSQPHYTRFNEAPKQKEKPGWTLKEVQKETVTTDTVTTSRAVSSSVLAEPPHRTGTFSRLCGKHKWKTSQQGGWASRPHNIVQHHTTSHITQTIQHHTSCKSLLSLSNRKRPEHCAPRRCRSAHTSLQDTRATYTLGPWIRQKPAGPSAGKPGWHPGFDIN